MDDNPFVRKEVFHRMTFANDDGYDLVKLSDSALELKNPNQDLRDRKVFDNNGEEIGTVEDLFADEEERRVRFLDVGAGGQHWQRQSRRTGR